MATRCPVRLLALCICGMCACGGGLACLLNSAATSHSKALECTRQASAACLQQVATEQLTSCVLGAPCRDKESHKVLRDVYKLAGCNLGSDSSSSAGPLQVDLSDATFKAMQRKLDDLANLKVGWHCMLGSFQCQWCHFCDVCACNQCICQLHIPGS